MRVLLTNNTLDQRAGTELYVRDVAVGLRRAGHQPICFTLEPGEVAREIQAAGVPVIDDLRLLETPPEVIHGHHRVETTLAALAFPRTPVVSFCHGPRVWPEAPCRMPNVVVWVAVDESCRERLVGQEGIDPRRVGILRNFVDLERFPVRAPLPERPRRALIFSNAADDHNYAAVIRGVCERRGIAVETAGLKSGRSVAQPGELLRRHDLVFAKGRAALEALAAGCAVIVCDFYGAGGFVGPAEYEFCRRFNFGVATMTRAVTPEIIDHEISRYACEAAREVCRRVRAEAGLDQALGRLVSLYQWSAAQTLPEFEPLAAAGDFLRWHLLLSKHQLNSLRPPKDQPFLMPAGPLRPGELSARVGEFLGTCESLPEYARRMCAERREMRERWIAAREEARQLKEQLRAQRQRSPGLPRRVSGWWHRLRDRPTLSELEPLFSGPPATARLTR